MREMDLGVQEVLADEEVGGRASGPRMSMSQGAIVKRMNGGISM